MALLLPRGIGAVDLVQAHFTEEAVLEEDFLHSIIRAFTKTHVSMYTIINQPIVREDLVEVFLEGSRRETYFQVRNVLPFWMYIFL